MRSKTTLFDKFVLILLIILPISNVYGFSDDMRFSTLATYTVIALFVLSGKLTKATPKRVLPHFLFIFFIYYYAVSFIMNISGGVYAMISLSIIQTFVISLIYWSSFQENLFIKYYKLFAIAFLIVFFLQESAYNTFGYRMSGLIPGLPTASSRYDMSEVIDRREFMDRSSSLFSEPAHLVLYLLPLLAIALYEDTKRSKIFAAIIVAALLLLRSGTALLGLGALLVYYIYSYPKLKGKKSKYRYIVLALIIAASALGVRFFLTSELSSFIFERTEELSTSYEGGSMSGFLRLWRGYYVYADYNPLEKLLGNPNKDAIIGHLKNVGMYFEDLPNQLYFNTFQTLLIRTGLVGLLLFSMFLIQTWKETSLCGRCIIVVFVALSFEGSNFFTTQCFVFLLLATNMKPKIQKQRVPVHGAGKEVCMAELTGVKAL